MPSSGYVWRRLLEGLPVERDWKVTAIVITHQPVACIDFLATHIPAEMLTGTGEYDTDYFVSGCTSIQEGADMPLAHLFDVYGMGLVVTTLRARYPGVPIYWSPRCSCCTLGDERYTGLRPFIDF